MMTGKTSIADELVLPSQAGSVIKPDNIVPHYMEPALERMLSDEIAGDPMSNQNGYAAVFGASASS